MTPDTKAEELLQVTQEDREAAANFAGVDISDGKTCRGRLAQIELYGRAVKVLARHRIDSQAELVAMLKLVTDALEAELGDRADDTLDEVTLIGWLGEKYGRFTIGNRIRVSQSRALLARLGTPS